MQNLEVKSFDAERSILIVEDDSEVRTLLGQLLGESGFNVYEAANGKEALSLLQSVNPLIILLDLEMPVMNGKELIEYLKSGSLTVQAWAKIPVIIYSASVENYPELIALTDAQLHKPVSIDVLIETIDQVLLKFS